MLPASSGDLRVADLTIDDDETITPTLGRDHVVEAVLRAERLSQLPREPDEVADFYDLAEPSLDALAELEEPVDVQVTNVIGDPSDELLLHWVEGYDPKHLVVEEDLADVVGEHLLPGGLRHCEVKRAIGLFAPQSVLVQDELPEGVLQVADLRQQSSPHVREPRPL